jgi:hypothetical protein
MRRACQGLCAGATGADSVVFTFGTASLLRETRQSRSVAWRPWGFGEGTAGGGTSSPVETVTLHRPVGRYFERLAAAGAIIPRCNSRR